MAIIGATIELCVYTSLLQITASDPDSSRHGTVRYGIYAPSGSESTSTDQAINSLALYNSVLLQSFSVDQSTGAVSLRRALSRDLPFGFSNWLMNVMAADEPGSPSSKSGYGIVSVRLIDINDHAPVFDTCCLRGAVPEGSSQGKVLMSD